MLVLFQWKLFDLRNVVPTFRWTTESQIASQTPGWIAALDQVERDAQTRQQQNVVALSTNLRGALASQDRKAIEAAAAKLASLGSRTVAGALGDRNPRTRRGVRQSACSRPRISPRFSMSASDS